MNGRQMQENPYSVNDESIDVHMPPSENFYPVASTNVSYLYDASGNGVTQSYSNPATILVHQMVQQLQMYVMDNQELKRSIKMNNAELEKRFQELELWKNTHKKEKLQLKEKFDKAYKSNTSLKNEIAILRCENMKLELQLKETPKGNLATNSVPETGKSAAVANQSDVVSEAIKSKYLLTVENLERQLKDAIQSKEKVETMQERLLQINRGLQQKCSGQQTQQRELEMWKQKYRTMDMSYQNLLKELKATKERLSVSEKTNKEVKAQLVQVLSDVSVYQTDNESLKSEKQKLQRELDEFQGLNKQLRDRFVKREKEYQNYQSEKKQELMNYEKKIAEKNKTLDELYCEYEKYRKDNERLSAEVDSMLARIICADESLQKRDRELKDLKESSMRGEARLKEDKRKLDEDVTFFKAQAAVYKQDFLQEREDRQNTHELNEQLRARLEQYENTLRR